MTKKIILASLLATLTFTACGTTQSNVTPTKQKVAIEKNIIAAEPTKSEVEEAEVYTTHVKAVKKRRKRAKMHKKKKINLKAFCFKDSHSIHYRAEERCKN